MDLSSFVPTRGGRLAVAVERCWGCLVRLMNDRSARGSVGCFYWLEIDGVYGLRENMHWWNKYGGPPFGETDKGGVAPSL